LLRRTSEALEAIGEAEKMTERYEEHWWCAELRRLRGVFLTALDAEGTQIEGSFCEAVRIAKEQKLVSLERRADATYTEYRSKRAQASLRGARLKTTSFLNSVSRQEQRQRAVVVIVTLVGSSIDLWAESDNTVFPRFELQAFATTSTGP
jgi:hypothetical protein